MVIAGVTMVKNEQDIIEYTVANMLKQVDFVIVADNMSTDNTRGILDDLATRYDTLIVIDDLDPAYEQSRKMTALAHTAGGMDAEYVIPFDADEYWLPTQYPTIKQAIEETKYDIYVAPIYNYIPTGPGGGNPIRDITYRLAAVGELKKVACKIRPDLIIAMGNHSAHYADHMPTYNLNDLEVRHYPWRTPEQFVNKAIQGAVALEKTNLPYEVGQHWRRYKEIALSNGIEALEEVFKQYFYSDDPANNDELVYDPVIKNDINDLG